MLNGVTAQAVKSRQGPFIRSTIHLSGHFHVDLSFINSFKNLLTFFSPFFTGDFKNLRIAFIGDFENPIRGDFWKSTSGAVFKITTSAV